MTQPADPARRAELIAQYRAGHAAVVAAVAGLTDAELDARPVEGEWTVREIAHHLADSELDVGGPVAPAHRRGEPVVAGYDETEFARRLHYDDRPIGPSLDALAAARRDHPDPRAPDRRTSGRGAGHAQRAAAHTASSAGSRSTPRTPRTTPTRSGAHAEAAAPAAPVDTPAGRPAKSGATPDDQPEHSTGAGPPHRLRRTGRDPAGARPRDPLKSRRCPTVGPSPSSSRPASARA